MRWEEPHHPGPWVKLCATLSHLVPLCNTKLRADGTPSVGRNCYPVRRGTGNRLGEAIFGEPGPGPTGGDSAPDLQAALQLQRAEEGVRVCDERREDHQQDGGNQHQGDDQLDLRCRPGGAFLGSAPRVGAQSSRLLVELPGKR